MHIDEETGAMRPTLLLRMYASRRSELGSCLKHVNRPISLSVEGSTFSSGLISLFVSLKLHETVSNHPCYYCPRQMNQSYAID